MTGIYHKVREWIMTGPGSYFAASPSDIWDAAWRNFQQHGRPGVVSKQLDFMFRLQRAGYELRATSFGGFVLDKLPS